MYICCCDWCDVMFGITVIYIALPWIDYPEPRRTLSKYVHSWPCTGNISSLCSNLHFQAPEYWLVRSQFLIRPVWRKISTWCDKLSFIQIYKLKRTSYDEISYHFESIFFALQKLIDRKSLITDKSFKKINLFLFLEISLHVHNGIS